MASRPRQTALSVLYYASPGLRGAFPLFASTRLRAFAPAHVGCARPPKSPRARPRRAGFGARRRRVKPGVFVA